MNPNVIKYLDYGVLGLCAIMLIAAWRLILREQSRQGAPRKAILKSVELFIGFCLILAGINAWVQMKESEYKRRVTALESTLNTLDVVLQGKLYTEVTAPASEPSKERIREEIARMRTVIEQARNPHP